MNKNFIPTPQDEKLKMQAAVTKTASFDSAWLDLGENFAPGSIGMPAAAVVQVTAADRANSDETYTFTLQECPPDADGAADTAKARACGATESVDVDAATATLGCIAVGGFISQRFVRVAMVAAGTTPSITYAAWLNTNV